jgi:flagellar biosynthesis protein FlhB
MAETERDERTESATPKRLEEARKRGQVPRSPELGAAAVTLTAGAAMYFTGRGLAGSLDSLMRNSLAITRDQLADEAAAIQLFQRSMLETLLAVAPVLGSVFLAALAAPLLLGGWNFSAEALGMRLERINPANGFQRMFSVRSLVELGKSMVKFLLVGTIAVLVLRSKSGEILALSTEPIRMAVGHSLTLCAQALLMMAGALGLIAAVDAPYQIWQHHKDLRMTRQEVRDESKETDGSPEVKGRIRSMQQEIARRRMMQEVPKADVVVTNPTHYAVALRYDERRMRAPVVVAKGAGEVAAKIREVAAESGVPLLSAPPLARVLFRNVDIGVEIPAALYAAVAQVLTWVLQLKAARREGVQLPPEPVIDPAVESLGRKVEG